VESLQLQPQHLQYTKKCGLTNTSFDLSTVAIKVPSMKQRRDRKIVK
jgi:hypothetical protein